MRYAALLILPLLLLAACREQPRAVPREYAWPRLYTYPAAYHPLPGAPAHLEVNDSTTMVSDRPGWYTLTYPRYGATLYLSFVDVPDADMESNLHNRLQRISLNAGDLPVAVTELTTDGGWQARLFRVYGTATPLQILAYRPGTVLSGALFTGDTAAPPDSLRPAVDAVEADLLHALKHLR